VDLYLLPGEECSIHLPVSLSANEIDTVKFIGWDLDYWGCWLKRYA